MSRRLLVVVVPCCCLVAVVAVGAVRGWFWGEDPSSPPAPPQDLSNHPIYSTYQFGDSDRVIDVGMQPLWIPTNMIVEAMRRDAVLEKALAAEGREIRFHPFLKGADVNFFLKRGDLEVAIGGDMPALSAAAEAEAVVAALIQQGFCAIVARCHMLMVELRGKRIAYAFGSNAHYSLLHSLSSAGLGEGDVRLVPLDVNEMSDALDDGRIDAFSAWEPTPFLAEKNHQDQVVIHRSLTSGYLYFSRRFADGQPEMLRRIVAAEVRAIRWMGQADNLLQAGRWAGAAAQTLRSGPQPLSAGEYVALAKNDLLGTVSVPAIPAGDLAADGRLFKEFMFIRDLGKITSTASWDRVRSCFDRSIVAEVLSAGRKYELATYEYQLDEGPNHGQDG